MRRPQRLLLILMLISTGCANNSLPRGTSDPQTIVLRLSRGNFPVLVYEPKGEIKGTLLFGSGDGGWKIWEERACRSLALDGWRVIGWDCRQYASDRFVPYGAQILGRDLQTMVSVGIGGRSQGKPVFYGGYSTGAEQAVSGSAWMLSRQGASELPAKRFAARRSRGEREVWHHGGRSDRYDASWSWEFWACGFGVIARTNTHCTDSRDLRPSRLNQVV